MVTQQQFPLVTKAGPVTGQGRVLLELDRNPFGRSIAVPAVFVAKGQRADLRFALNSRVDLVLAQMVTTGQVVSATVLGEAGGNFIMLDMGMPEVEAPEFALYTKLVHFINWLYARSGSPVELPLPGHQFAEKTDLDRPDRVQFNAARAEAYAETAASLVHAFNLALETGLGMTTGGADDSSNVEE